MLREKKYFLGNGEYKNIFWAMENIKIFFDDVKG